MSTTPITASPERCSRALAHWQASRLRAPPRKPSRHRHFNLLALWQDEGGVIAVLTAIGLTVFIGIIGLGIDVGMWYRTNRALQNAADAAVIAAALNKTASYQSEAKAVAANYGFVDGTNGITVTALNNQTCPGGAPDCYQVTIAQATAPVFFSPVIGNFSPSLAGAAMAGGSQTHSYCLLALGSSGTDPAILGNGVPAANLDNCSIMSNTGMTCHGHNTGATNGDAHGTNSGCGITENSNVPAVADPYAGLATNIPANTCGTTASSFPQESGGLQTKWPASLTSPLPATQTICGDLQLTADTTLTTASPGSVLVIYNGQLDTNAHTLKTATGSALTIIFTGPTVSGHSYTHAPTGGGTLNFNAPTSGTWSGVAIYQDPALTAGVDISAAGSSPNWDISGLVYLPHSSVLFSGAVNNSSYGASCFALVVDNITINGTGEILKTGGCVAAGLNLPTNNVGAIALLQ
jgi:Flp pilus assembly protein TadG